MKLTKKQIKATINNMNTDNYIKREIQKQCDKGNSNTLFSVHFQMMKQCKQNIY